MTDPAAVDPNALPPLPAAPASATPTNNSVSGGKSPYLKYFLVLVGVSYAFLTGMAIMDSMPTWAMSIFGGIYEWVSVTALSIAVQPDGSLSALRAGGIIMGLLTTCTVLGIFVGIRRQK